MKIVFCGFDFFYASLASFRDCGVEISEVFHHEVDGVYNQIRQVSELCNKQGIKLSTGAVASSDIARFKANGVKMLVTAGYRYRIPVSALDECGIIGINIHPSYLPVGRGPWPMPVAILRGQSYSGVTIHKLAHHFDSGDILLQERIPLTEKTTLELLSARTKVSAAKLVARLMNDFDSIFTSAKPQNSGEYWPCPNEHDRSIDWYSSVHEIERLVRAFGKFDSYANFSGVDWLVQGATVWEEAHEFRPGEVISTGSTEIVIAASDGFVCLHSYRKETP